MVNKRLLIKNLLTHFDECTFYDKKLEIDIATEKGKSRLLKHICALCNSNPDNDSFILNGVSNDDILEGVPFIDDANIQNLVKAYLTPPPSILYENIAIPDLPHNKSIGILTISSNGIKSKFQKSIGKIKKGSQFHRIGSISEPTDDRLNQYFTNKKIIDDLYSHSKVSINELIQGVVDFLKMNSYDYSAEYHVFKDQFVICWGGNIDDEFIREVDVQIINEGVRLFFTVINKVKVQIRKNSLKIIEHKVFGFKDNYRDIPCQLTKIKFHDNGKYYITKKSVFNPPRYPKNDIIALYEKASQFLNQLQNQAVNMDDDFEFSEGLANYFFICYLNGIDKAKIDFYDSLKYLDGASAEWASDCKMILEEYEKTP